LAPICRARTDGRHGGSWARETTPRVCSRAPPTTAPHTWRVIKLLGSGGFGDVYKVAKVNDPDKTESAMKTEMVVGNRQMLRLKIEVLVLMKCHEQTDPARKGHFVAFVDRGKTDKFKFLVMGLVGPSLEDIRRKDLLKNYSKATAMTCCIQTLTALRDLHGIGYIHRDIKPQNYAIGLGEKESTIYMLDFGIARKYTVACHKQIEQGCKDDLECWLYMVPLQKFLHTSFSSINLT
uniref:Protein kinase domain-containing protein n=1 Tax=Angiostrongylus costaricensis TaxID=334426 RepID=A0A0R3PPP7_ANGCS